MAENNFSCIKEVIQTVNIPLPSFYVGKETKGVSEVLDSWKRQYNHQLQGILVNYKDISLKYDGSRSVVIDKPFVRYCVTATFELFCPSIGSIVKGTINRISHDYIGCLIHNTINATIKRFKRQPCEINQFVALDNMILFQVTCFDFYRKSIRVKGEISEECINLMKELPDFHMQSSTFLSASEFSEDTMNSDDVDKNKENDVLFEDEESPSLLSVDYSTLKTSNSVSNFNIHNSGEEISESATLFETPSPSRDSNSSSSSESNDQSYNPSTLGEKKSKKHKLNEIVDKHELEPKKKKKHKDKKTKEKSAKKKGSTKHEKSQKKRKKSKKEELLQNSNLFGNSDWLEEKIVGGIHQEFSMADDDLTDSSSQSLSTVKRKSSVEKKKNKKLKNTLEIKRKSSPKKFSKSIKEHRKNISGSTNLTSEQNNADMIGNTAVSSNALVKEEISTDAEYPSSSKRKKSKESKNSTDNVLQNTSLNQDSSTDISSQPSLSSKKKKHKKSKDVFINIPSENDTSNRSFSLNAADGIFRVPNTSPKKQKKSESLTHTKKGVNSYSVLDRTSIKEEIHSDVDSDLKSINCVLQNDFNTCSPGGEKNAVFPYNSTDELMNAFSMFEPSLEDQLMHNKASTSNITEDIETKKGKKRKRNSSDKSDQSKKKRKIEDDKYASEKSKDKLHKKSKKEKEKSEKNSKKDKKKKLKDKPVKSKKKSLEHKIKLKKNKKLKDVKSKKDKKDKSSHRETKHVPSNVIKSENN